MKKIIVSFLTFTLLLSCESHDNSNAKVDLSGLDIDLKGSKMGGKVELFSYENTEELLGNIDKSVNSVIEDSEEILKNNSEITNVLVDISFTNGEAVLTKILYVNQNTKKLIEGYEFDVNTNSYAKFSPVLNMTDILDGTKSSDDFSQIVLNSNLNNPQTEISKAIQAFLSANIISSKDCANVHLNVGVINISISGKNC